MIQLENFNSEKTEEELSIINKQKLRNRNSSPFRALFTKNVALQSKSVFTNICQIITPLICLAFTIIVRQVVNDKVVTKIGSIPYPQPFNIPGVLNLIPQFNLTCNQYYMYESSIEARKQVQRILNKTLSVYCPDVEKVTPYFIESKNLNQDVFKILLDSDKVQFVRGADLNSSIPDGIIKFNRASKQQLDVVVAINDYRIPEYHRANGITKLNLNLKNQTNLINSYLRVTEGEMSIMDLVSRAYLNTYQPKQIILSSFMYMPFSGEDRTLLLRIVNVIGSSLYPLALTLLLPIFLYSIVSEKQQKLLEMMKLNSLSMIHYWAVTFLFNLLLSCLTFSTFYIFGTYILDITFFQQTSGVLIFVILFGWALAQIGLANFFQVFISKAKAATIIGYLIAIFTTLIGQALAAGIYPVPLKMPFALRTYPIFSLCRLFYMMSFNCSNGSCIKSINHINEEMTQSIIILYLSVFLFFISIYLHEVVQQEYGVKKDIKFIVKPLLRWFANFAGQSYNQYNSQVDTFSDDTSNPLEDESVRQEKHKVSLENNYSKYPLLIKNIQKKYEFSNGEQDYIAVKPISFSLKQKQIFGLLGPNGAGKTSLISVITGVYPPTRGNAYVHGFSVRTEMQQIRMQIGVCPQFDLLWDELTSEQHLYFYARLKGINEQSLPRKVFEALQQVKLNQFKDLPSSKLSGGMKRRLSIAIALVGDPSVVFLDEPSSGLDPQHRRDLWNILLECKTKRSLLLTTHSMQQADALCNRIGIITEGVLRCIGTQTDLKLKYGSGYNLSINLKKSDEQILKQNVLNLDSFIKENIKSMERIQFNQNLVYKLNKGDNELHKIFKLLNQNKANLCIEDWSISQPSLYDVFINVVNSQQQEEEQQ